jgi:hypothetical protein
MAHDRDPFVPPLIHTRAMREAERLTVRQIRWRFAAAVALAATGLFVGVALLVTLA